MTNIIFEREKLKETNEYKRAIKKERALRRQELHSQDRKGLYGRSSINFGTVKLIIKIKVQILVTF